MILVLIKPILLAFLQSTAVRQLVVDLLDAYAKSTDNTIDDAAVELIKRNIFVGGAPAPEPTPEPEAPAEEEG